VAADVRHHPYGTQLYLPGYGWGRVEDDGGRSLGPGNVELFFDSREAARAWGERSLSVMSVQPQADAPRTPKRVVKGAGVRLSFRHRLWLQSSLRGSREPERLDALSSARD
jgi:hypothetical protein